MVEDDLNNVWNDLVDGINELESDLKGNRRGLRHLKSVRITVNEIDVLLRGLAKKKGLFK